jgi:prepilin-type N-terminal cleavage/methylation domain-containing protein
MAMRAGSRQSGMTLMEVMIAMAFIAIALLAVLAMVSTGYNSVAAGGSASKATDYARQQVEFLKNVPVTDARFANGNDTPEAGVARSWTVATVGATVTPNRLWRITVATTVNQTGQPVGAPGISLETMRAE